MLIHFHPNQTQRMRIIETFFSFNQVLFLRMDVYMVFKEKPQLSLQIISCVMCNKYIIGTLCWYVWNKYIISFWIILKIFNLSCIITMFHLNFKSELKCLFSESSTANPKDYASFAIFISCNLFLIFLNYECLQSQNYHRSAELLFTCFFFSPLIPLSSMVVTTFTLFSSRNATGCFLSSLLPGSGWIKTRISVCKYLESTLSLETSHFKNKSRH